MRIGIQGLDRIFVDAMLEYESSWAGSTFTVPGWQMIVTRFNHISCLHYTKAQLLCRWKNLKKDYSAYLYLRNKSGWDWDVVYNRLIPPSDSAWFEIDTANIATSPSCTSVTFKGFSVRTLPLGCMPPPLVHVMTIQ